MALPGGPGRTQHDQLAVGIEFAANRIVGRRAHAGNLEPTRQSDASQLSPLLCLRTPRGKTVKVRELERPIQ